MLKLDRAKFWKGYHKGFDAYGPTTQATVNALNVILDKFETESRLKNLPQFSYCLATWYHETGIDGNHFVPVREKKAGYRTEVWKKYQSKYWHTGFFGRGLDQTTFETNYRKAGEAIGLGDAFVQNPDLLLKIEYAYDGAVSGMVSGRYRADKSKQRYSLPRFFKDDDASLQDYFDARDIINGDKNRVVRGKKNGLLIAETAEKFENILRLAKISAAAAPLPVVDQLDETAHDPDPTSPTPDGQAAPDVGSTQTPNSSTDDSVNVEQNAETIINEGSLIDKASEAGDKFQYLQGVLDKFGFSVVDAKRSIGTVLLTWGKALFAMIMTALGVFLNHWELFVIAGLLLILAYLIWDRSGKRVAEAKAGVPVEVAKEMLK